MADHDSTHPPPPPSSAGAPGRDNGWRPADDDDTPIAVAWRARHSLRIVREVRAETEDLRESIKSLAKNVGSLTGAVNSVKGLVGWALGLVAASAVLGSAKLLWDWLSTLHH